MDYDIYEIKDILEKDILSNEEIKGILNHLLSEVEYLRNYREYLHNLIPTKYKKFNPKSCENPFFSLNDHKPSPEDFESSKKRMADLLKQGT